MKGLVVSVRMLLALMLLTGVLYPCAVWVVGQVAFRGRAEGSLLMHDGRVVGSELLAQKVGAPRYFWPRPSAADFATVPSGASNQTWTSAQLATAIDKRRAAAGGETLPPDLLTASGSGLDPHVSPAGARAQLDRVAAARGFDARQRQALDALVARLTEGGGLSPERVNVLRLNLALDEMNH